MKNSSSECSSRRESGWTMYFDQSSNYGDQFYKADDKDFRSKVANVKEDDEDLSMVSDASSGPPQFCEDEGCFDETRYFGYASSAYEQAKKGEKKKKTKERRGKKQHSYLDDTASSPVLRFSEIFLVDFFQFDLYTLAGEIFIFRGSQWFTGKKARMRCCCCFNIERKRQTGSSFS
ncbi:protein SOB FIVE-LIKE 5-like isoform X1 [Cornus florida]|uniref:protein SOB FIVE-LIKE 5-like isoform X1 n=1 Tax=Cornus florida TaxID=4283 RepID=UPI00289E595C|nr:protein SOB FIVE-LIKE 5-like isoform X1 [Cornus florida]